MMAGICRCCNQPAQINEALFCLDCYYAIKHRRKQDGKCDCSRCVHKEMESRAQRNTNPRKRKAITMEPVKLTYYELHSLINDPNLTVERKEYFRKYLKENTFTPERVRIAAHEIASVQYTAALKNGKTSYPFDKIQGIKTLRELTFIGLKEAKDAFELAAARILLESNGFPNHAETLRRAY